MRRFRITDILDSGFFAFATLATLWLAWVLLTAGFRLTWSSIAYVVIFWGVLSYLALPRLHQVLTWLYVPDYFIGRTRTTDGLLGDPVNLAVQGDEAAIHEAMTAAGWVRADPITLGSSWRIITSSVFGRSYPAAPVSTLTLFGRGQDFAYQKEVEGNPAQRHHVRFWHVPDGWVMPGGGKVDWLAAGTYDRAVGLSSFTLQVTHKIDADIDIERNYIVDDVAWASPQAQVAIWPEFFTSYHATNGGGDRVRTDGDLYVLDLQQMSGEYSRDSLARAKAAEREAALHTRPNALIQAVLFIILQLIADGTMLGSLVLNLADDPTITDEQTAFIAVTSAIAMAVVSIIIAVLTVFTWRGVWLARCTLMGVLAATIVSELSELTTLGAAQAGAFAVLSTALGVLALLALTARDVHVWERLRATTRAQMRAQKRAQRRDRASATR